MINGKKGKYFTLLLVLASGILLSLSLFYWTYKAEQAGMQSRFNEIAGHRFKDIEDVVQYNTAALESFGGLYASSETVSGQEFDTFAQGIFRRQNYIFEFRWLERVADERRNEFEEAMRKSGQADFTIKEPDEKGGLIPAHKRKEYFVVRFVSYSPNQAFDPSVIIGLDAASIPERRQAMQFSCDNMAMAATGEVRHFGEPEIKASSRIFLPVYRNNLPHQTLQERRENLLGFVVMLYRLDSMIKESIGATPFLGMDFAIYRVDGGRKQLLYLHSSRTRENPIEASQLDTRSGISWTGSFKMADQDWQIACTPAPSFLAANKIVLPWVSLAVGLILTFLVTLYLRVVIGRSKTVELLVRQRTDELEEARKRIDFILAGTKTHIDIIDGEFNIVYVDAAWEKIYGDPQGKKCYQYLMDRDAVCPGCGIKKALETKQAAVTERVLPKEGNRPVQVVSYPFQDKAGRWMAAEVKTDITERKKTEEALRKIEWLLTKDLKRESSAKKPLRQQAYGNVVELNTSRVILDAVGEDNLSDIVSEFIGLLDTCTAVYEKNGDYAYGNFTSDWCHFLDEASRRLCGSVSNKEALSSGKWLCHESCWNEASRVSIETAKPADIECAGGIHIYAVPIFANKEAIGSLNFGYGDPPTDPQKLGELATKYNLSPDKLIGLARVYESRPAYIIDFAKERLLVAAKMIGEIVERKQAQETTKRAEEELEKSKAELEVEAWGLSKANEGIRLLYKELEEKNEALKKIDQLKSDFVSTVSHELRTPLAIMKEGVSLVLDKITGEVNPQQEKTLGMVYSNINRLSQLITDLLDISKIEAGRVQLKKTLVDAGALVKDIAEKWRLESDKKKQKLQIAVPQKPVRIYLDSDKAIQVLNNLISNAIKYTPEGGAINVGLSERQDDVLLVVSDSGIGIASEDLPHAFERFRQFSRAPGAGAKGTGLGLAITRELVNLHEGTISVDSKLNKGSSFSITLPKMDSETVFKQHILSGIKEAAEKNSHLAVVTVKISDFAKLQKELGYDRMHGLLKEIEDTINSSLRRKADTVVRDTGELIVLLFDANKKSASLVRERISSVMQSFLEKKRAQGLEAVVFNIGLAAYPEDAADEGDLLNKARGVVKAKSENA